MEEAFVPLSPFGFLQDKLGVESTINRQMQSIPESLFCVQRWTACNPHVVKDIGSIPQPQGNFLLSWRCSQVAKHLPSMPKVLGSSPHAKRRKDKNLYLISQKFMSCIVTSNQVTYVTSRKKDRDQRQTPQQISPIGCFQMLSIGKAGCQQPSLMGLLSFLFSALQHDTPTFQGPQHIFRLTSAWGYTPTQGPNLNKSFCFSQPSIHPTALWICS